MNQTFDLIIIGAGPAGSLTAHLCCQAGMNVLLVDQMKEVRRKVCGEYLCPKGADLLSDLGFSEWLKNTFLPVFGMEVFSSKGKKVHTVFPDSKFGYSLHRKIFDSYLLEKAKSSGTTVLLETKFQNLEIKQDQILVETSVGNFATSLLFGADGRNSKVSKHFQNDKKSHTKKAALHVHVDSKTKNSRFGEMHLFSDGSYIGLDPTGEFEMNLSLVCLGEKITTLGGPKEALNHYIKKSKELSTRYDLELQPAEISAVSPIQHQVKTVLPHPQVALLGDAGGFVDPLTGEGIYQAILSASMISELLIHADRTLESKKEALQHYEYYHQKSIGQKSRVNQLFQNLIQHPKLVELLANYISKSESRSNAFIGLVGNVYTPWQALPKILF